MSEDWITKYGPRRVRRDPPTLDEAIILDALRASIDPVFLPRPLRLVQALPRNETGKLPRAALLDLLARHIPA